MGIGIGNHRVKRGNPGHQFERGHGPRGPQARRGKLRGRLELPARRQQFQPPARQARKLCDGDVIRRCRHIRTGRRPCRARGGRFQPDLQGEDKDQPSDDCLDLAQATRNLPGRAARDLPWPEMQVCDGRGAEHRLPCRVQPPPENVRLRIHAEEYGGGAYQSD